MQKDTIEKSSILQCQIIFEGIRRRLGNNKKPILRTKNSDKDVCSKSHSAESPKDASMLAKLLVPSKNQGASSIKTN